MVGNSLSTVRPHLALACPLACCGTIMTPYFMKKGILFIVSLLLFWGSFSNIAFAGFGITPPYVRNDTLRPGSEYTQEIIIVRSDPVEDLNAELTLNLPNIEPWFSFDRGLKFVLPRGESQVKMHITVRVPDDAKLGGYNGNVRIRTMSAAGPASGVSLALGAQIDVHLNVVNQIFDFAVRRVEVFEAQQGFRKFWLDFPGKIKFAIYLENTGNVPAAPYKVTMNIYDASGQQLLETTENTNQIETILPFDTKKVLAYLPTWLPPGGYKLKYDIQKNETDSSQKGELSLAVLPRGSISGYEDYGFDGLTLPDKLSVVIPASAITLVVMLFVIFRLNRPRKRKVKAPKDNDEYEPPMQRPRPRNVHSNSGVVDLSRRR